MTRTADFSISIDTRATIAALDALARKQAPFATALALTKTAQAAQAEVKRTLPQRFTIRNNFVEKGIRVEAARKRDWPRPRAAVYSKDRFMALQETGGVKTGKSGGSVGVPVTVRRTPKQTLPPSRWPKALLRKPNHFILQTRNGPALARRKGGGIELLYGFAKSVKVKPRLGMASTVENVARKAFVREFEKALAHAMRTAR